MAISWAREKGIGFGTKGNMIAIGMELLLWLKCLYSCYVFSGVPVFSVDAACAGLSLLLTWIELDSSMEKQSQVQWSVWWNYLLIVKLFVGWIHSKITYTGVKTRMVILQGHIFLNIEMSHWAGKSHSCAFCQLVVSCLWLIEGWDTGENTHKLIPCPDCGKIFLGGITWLDTEI